MPTEGRFYGYDIGQGIYQPVREAHLNAKLSRLLLMGAREAKGVGTQNLEYKLRSTGRLDGVLRRARGILEVEDDFFDTGLTEFIPCANGMLRVSDMTLVPFSPDFRRRNKLGVSHSSTATCPSFLGILLRPALNEADIKLLQRWCGLALVGNNLAQKILLITGTAGGGKGTFVRVLTGIIGKHNLASLRTRCLHNRFEIGRLVGKSLLYGADVDEGFLSTEGASILKSLTGGDPVSVEFKRKNSTPELACHFNVVVTCNTLPQIRLQGDVDAWRRRMAIIEFRRDKPKREIVDLSERILAEEGPGILNWMLEGLQELRQADWRLELDDSQRRRVDDLLGESDSVAVFVQEARVAASAEANLTTTACYGAYVQFCQERGWQEVSRKKFGNVIGELIARRFGLTARHDVDGGDGSFQRGWKGIRFL